MKRLLLVVLAFLTAAPAAAQDLEDSIVVTGTRIAEDSPGVYLTRNGDFLLLPVTVVNDSRDEKQREDEIYKTLLRMLEKARSGALELSVVEGDFVRPLTKENHKIKLMADGSRPDTSRAHIHVSTPVTGKAKPGALIDKLRAFVTETAVVGRTELTFDDEIEISIVNPNQYRDKIIGLVAADIKRVTDALGEGYRIHLTGIDRQVKWVRSGPTEVMLYIPYAYEILPAANAYFINNNNQYE